MRRKVAMFVAIHLIAILLVGGGVAFYLIEKYGLTNIGGIKELRIAENVEFGDDWKEIGLGKVEFPDKEYNSILIYAQLAAKRNGFETPDGEVFYPEVMMEDHEGNKCFLKFMWRRTLNSLRFEGEESDSTSIKCFSITFAPSATETVGTVMPNV